MKILTKEEERQHYDATLKGGIGGGVAGLGIGLLGVYGAQWRYPAFRALTLPLKAFLVTSAGTFTAIISADRYSRSFESSRNPEDQYRDSASQALAQATQQQTALERFYTFGRENRYPIVGVSWVASMGIALAIVGRSPYLTTPQKLVQARVYAQGLTLAVLLITAIFEVGDRGKGEGRWETIQVLDENDPTHQHLIEKRIHHESYRGEDQWRDMIETEERKMKEREDAAKEQEERDRKSGKFHPKHHKKNDEHRDEKKNGDSGDEKKDGGKKEKK